MIPNQFYHSSKVFIEPSTISLFFFLFKFISLALCCILFIYNPQYLFAAGKQLFLISGCILNFKSMLIMISISLRFHFGRTHFSPFPSSSVQFHKVFMCHRIDIFFLSKVSVAQRRTLNLFYN